MNKKYIANHLLRLSKEKAIKYLERKQCNFRIVKEDKKSYMIISNYQIDRFNLVIENNRIIEVYMG